MTFTIPRANQVPRTIFSWNDWLHLYPDTLIVINSDTAKRWRNFPETKRPCLGLLHHDFLVFDKYGKLVQEDPDILVVGMPVNVKKHMHTDTGDEYRNRYVAARVSDEPTWPLYRYL